MKHSYLTVTDQFCGAGGSSIGAVAAGAELKLALNHWKLAIETHNSNFPEAHHECTDISACDPRRYLSTDILITSPECTNHSLAKGKQRKWQQQLDMFGKLQVDPAEERSRATMWDVCRFAEAHQYNIIIVENVVEARHWVTWDAWLHAMQLLGYEWECVYFNSMFAHPTPQSRDRMYVVFWRRGNRAPNLKFTPLAYCPKCERNVEGVQSWKDPRKKWGKYRTQYIYCCPQCAGQVEPYYYCAANAIDWQLPAPRIGDRPKQLKERTLRRIQIGLERFGWQPTLVGNYSPGWVRPMSDPTGTVTGADHHALCTPPFLLETKFSHAQSDRSTALDQPSPTQTSQQTQALVVPPFLVELRHNKTTSGIEEALSTMCAGGGHHGLVVPFLTSYYGTGQNSDIREAVPTIPTRDRHGLVMPPFLVSYYTRLSGAQAAIAGVDEPVPTVPGWAVHYLAQPGETPAVEDCGFRMLQPHEIHRAMAFPEGYIVLGNQRQKVKQYGNAVTPPVMRQLLERCIATLS
jgi:DNA (cytosine-5)-methyltransferase 1